MQHKKPQQSYFSKWISPAGATTEPRGKVFNTGVGVGGEVCVFVGVGRGFICLPYFLPCWESPEACMPCRASVIHTRESV